MSLSFLLSLPTTATTQVSKNKNTRSLCGKISQVHGPGAISDDWISAIDLQISNLQILRITDPKFINRFQTDLKLSDEEIAEHTYGEASFSSRNIHLCLLDFQKKRPSAKPIIIKSVKKYRWAKNASPWESHRE